MVNSFFLISNFYHSDVNRNLPRRRHFRRQIPPSRRHFRADFSFSAANPYTNHAIYYTVNAKYSTIISNFGYFEGGVQGRGCPLQARNAIISVVDCINSTVIAKYSVVKRYTNVKTSATSTENQRFMHFRRCFRPLFFRFHPVFVPVRFSAGLFFVFSGGMCVILSQTFLIRGAKS